MFNSQEALKMLSFSKNYKYEVGEIVPKGGGSQHSLFHIFIRDVPMPGKGTINRKNKK